MDTTTGANLASNAPQALDSAFATNKSTVKDKPIPLDSALALTPNRVNTNTQGYNFQDIHRYNRFINQIYPSTNLERQAAANQSGWGKVGNMLAQGIGSEVVTQGFIGGVGSLVGLPKAIWNELHGRDAEFNNFLTRFADNVTEHIEDRQPIFRYNPGASFDWRDLGWWTSGGVSFLSTLGLLIPSGMAVKGAGYFSKALKGVSEAAKINKATKLAGKVLDPISDVFNTERYWQKLTHSAFAMRNAENFRESSQNFNLIRDDAFETFKDDEAYQKALNSEVGEEYLAEGRTPSKLDFANFIASKASWRQYAINAGNVVFDAMQLAPLFRSFKVKTSEPTKFISNKVRAAQNKVLGVDVKMPAINAHSFVKGGSLFFGEQLTEGVEELINAIAQSEGNWYGKHLTEGIKNEGYAKRLSEYLASPSTWEQAFWGFLGGVAFSGGTRAIKSIDDVINDRKDPHSDEARIEEITNRSIILSEYGRQINSILEGNNPKTNQKLTGSVEEIKESQDVLITEALNRLGTNLGINASKHGNVQLLLDMIEHNNFKEILINSKIADEDTFNERLTNLKNTILNAEKTYKKVFDKIFTSTNDKPWIRELIIEQAVQSNSSINYLTKRRENLISKINDLRSNNPAFNALKESNKDRAFEDTLDNIINAATIELVDFYISSEKDENIKKTMRDRSESIKEVILEKNKSIKGNEATGNFQSISDLISLEAERRLYDIFIHTESTLYENIVNTDVSVPKIEKDIKDSVKVINEIQFRNFKNTISSNSKIEPADTPDTIDSKIKTIDDLINTIKNTKEDPYVAEGKPTKKLTDAQVREYVSALENRKAFLSQEKTRRLSLDSIKKDREVKNAALIQRVINKFKDLKVDKIGIEFTGKRDPVLNKFVNNRLGDLIEFINDDQTKFDITDENIKQIHEYLNIVSNKGLFEEFINEILIAAGYITEYDTDLENIVEQSKSNQHITNAENFKNSVGDIKAVIDYTSQNPTSKNFVDFANKWITEIINDGTPLFTETNPDGTPKKTGTRIDFSKIAAKYGEIVGADRLKEDFEYLKRAYLIVSDSKVNPQSGTTRIYNTEKTLKRITVQHIIDTFNIRSDFKDYEFFDTSSLTKTGGEESTNIYLPNITADYTSDENGNLTLDKDADSRLELILNRLQPGSKVELRVNTELKGEKGFSQNKNNSGTIPISVYAVEGNERIFIGAINTIPTTHFGLKYSFNGTDWTDILLKDSTTSNNKIDILNRLFPLLAEWYNNQKYGIKEDSEDNVLDALLEADPIGLIPQMLGGLDVSSKEGKDALRHICRVIFYSEDIDGTTPIEFNRSKVLEKIKTWKDKLYRDHINNTKIRNAIGTNVDAVIETTVSNITSGNIITARTSSGIPVYSNLNIILNKGKLKLYKVKTDTNKTLIENVNDNSDMIPNKKGKSFGFQLYVGVEGGGITETGSNIVPVPVFLNTIGGGMLSSSNSDSLVNSIFDTLKSIGELRVQVRDATNKKDYKTIEDAHAKIDELQNKLKDHVLLDFKEQSYGNVIISNNKDIRFKIGTKNGVDQYIVYDYYTKDVTKQFRYERYDEEGIVTKATTEEDFKEKIGNLRRSVNYSRFKDKEFISITGERYDSYQDYLISTNSIVTDVGVLKNSTGKPISNFAPRSNTPVGGINLMVNISTSGIKTTVPTTPSFIKFANDLKLNSNYDFLFQIFDSLTRNSDITFDVSMTIDYVDPTTGKKAYVFYDTKNKKLVVTKEWKRLYDKGNIDAASLTIAHDILHALIDSRSAEEKTKLYSELTKFKETVLNSEQYKAIVAKENKTDLDNAIITIFNHPDVEEILTYGLTDIGFAKFLDSIKSSENKITTSLWTKLKEIIRTLARSVGFNTKLDELNYIFDSFMSEKKVDQNELNTIIGNLKEVGNENDLDFDQFGENDLDIKAVVNYSDSVLNKQQVIEQMIDGEHDLSKEILREELPKLSKEEFNKAAKQAGYYSLGKYWTVRTIADPDAIKYASVVTEDFNAFGFTPEERDHVLNVMSNVFIQTVAQKYKGTKAKEVGDGIRVDMIAGINNLRKKAINDGTWDGSKDRFLYKTLTTIRDNNEFWKLFKIQLNLKYGYDINEYDEFANNTEFLEKPWDQIDTYTKHVYSTISEEIKDLINTTSEIDPNSVEINEDGTILWKTNLNTPTGFANTLDFSKRGNKIIDLMRNCVTKQDMLDELFKYATVKDSVFASSLLSIHKKLVDDPNLLNTWYSSFSKAIVDSYRDLYRSVGTEEHGVEYEYNISYGNKKAVEYQIANEWADTIISRAQNGYYTADKIKKWNDLYATTARISSNFTTLDDVILNNIIELYNIIGIRIGRDNLIYEFREHKGDFIRNMISPIRYIKQAPGVKLPNNNTPYIEKTLEDPKAKFEEFGNLLSLAKRTKYFNEDNFTFSSLNTNGNLVSDAGNSSFITNLFKKLNNSDDVIFETLAPYLEVPSNQNSLILWGDEIKNGEAIVQGRGLINYERNERGIKVPTSKKNILINKDNLNNLKFYRYEGDKDLDNNKANVFSSLTQYDWTLKTLIYYLGVGKTEGTEIKHKTTAIFPILNPSDRKNTGLIEAPIIELSNSDYEVIATFGKTNDYKALRKVPLFRAIYNTAIDELLAMNVAKNILFKTDPTGKVIGDLNNPELHEDVVSGKVKPQLHYHYKRNEDGTPNYRKGNVFNINNIFVTYQNKELTFGDIEINGIKFVDFLLSSSSLSDALTTQIIENNPTSSFNARLEQFIAMFMREQLLSANKELSPYKEIITKTYLKGDNVHQSDRVYILKNKSFDTTILEFALNTYLFNVEQVRLLYGSVADYKTNIDLNKRGGQILAHGLSNSLTGYFNGATISDIKLKSNVYNHMINTFTILLGHSGKRINKEKISKVYTAEELESNTIIVNGVERKLFADSETGIAEREIYSYISPYLTNDSANAVSLVTVDEFVKRIKGYGLYNQYSDVINKIENNIELDREDYNKFATMQKNFYYSLDYSESLRKMIPNQIKNAEIILTPALVKDLQLESLLKVMKEKGISQINLESAEKIGSQYIAKINDDNGDLLDETTVSNELDKAIKPYNYSNLRMQLETPDAVYEEHITMGRQIVKKIIENIPDNVEYHVNNKTLSGKDLKSYYFDLLNENIYQSASDVTREFDIRIDKDGNIIGDVSYEKVIEYLEKSAFSRGLTMNLLYGLKIDYERTAGNTRVPIWFNTNNKKFESIITSIFTNNITNQTFPGIHAPQMSSLFMNRKEGVTQSELTSTEGINWHEKMFEATDAKGKKIKREDIKLRSNILFDAKEGIIYKAEVLLPRWAREFYEEDKETGKKLININNVPEEIRTMVGYRMPTEAKYSMYVFEVVGFLPDDNGPAIVLPDDFATKTGSDFDMDTVFALSYNISKIKHTETDPETGKKTTTTELIKTPYINESGDAAVNRRADLVMNDRSQLVHILSKELGNETLFETIGILNDIISNYFERNTLLKEKYKSDFDKLDNLNKRFKKASFKQKKSLEKEIFDIQSRLFTDDLLIDFRERGEYKFILNKVKTILSGLSIPEQNTRKARENEILDIYVGILSNPHHYIETVSLSTFKDITAVKGKIDNKLGIGKKRVNNLTFAGQQHYRNKSQQGRNLKGVSIGLSRFNSIAQVSGITLVESLPVVPGATPIKTLPKFKYKINASDIGRIRRDYKDDASFETIGVGEKAEHYVTITYRHIGNNPGNTFKNIENKYINTYAVEIAANILDNVAYPLPDNINSYTIDMWHMLISIGATYDSATTFLHQPIIRDLVSYHDANINKIKNGREIEDTKRKYQTLLYRCLRARGEINSIYDAQIANKQSIKINGTPNQKNAQYAFLGYENNKAITLFSEELDKNLALTTLDKGSFPELEKLLNEESLNLNRIKELEDFFRYQLQILETFKDYKKYATAVKDGASAINTDKIGAGPTFNVTNSLIHKLKKLHGEAILQIDGVSAVSRIYPKFFGRTEPSKYPSLEQHFILSNLLSKKMFKDFFIGQSDIYQFLIDSINGYSTEIFFNDKLANRVLTYFNNALLNDFNWLNDISIDEKRALLGINNKLDLLLDLDDSNLPIFEGLSVANQIELLKINRNYPSNHIISLISCKLQDRNIEENGYHVLEYINSENPDTVAQSINELWYSDNIYERIVARNLLKYEYLTNGFGFKFSSFAKVIPNNILFLGSDSFMEGSYNEQGIALSQHLYGKQRIINNLTIDNDSPIPPSEQLTFLANNLFGFNYLDSFLRSNYADDNLVPDAGKLTFFDPNAMDAEGNVGMNRRYFNTNSNGIIVMPAKTLHNIPTSRIVENVQSKELVKISITTKNGVEPFLFRRVDEFAKYENGQYSGYYYYYPVNKLEEYENGEKSLFPKNNLSNKGTEILSSEEYSTIIINLNKQNLVKDTIYKEQLNLENDIEAIKAGTKTAITGNDKLAEQFATAIPNTLIRIAGTNEYIRVVKNFTRIDLSNSREVRKIWAKKEGVDIERTHDVVNGVEFQNRTDLNQMEFVYAGTYDEIMKDAINEDSILEEGDDVQTDIKSASYTFSINESIKPGIDFVFEQNPELAEIGSKELYSAYLNTIFPNSKVKDIVYHKTEAYKNNKLVFDKFKRNDNNLAFYFTVQPKNLFNDNVVTGKYFPFIINIINPLITNEQIISLTRPYRNEDGWIIDKGSINGWYVVFEPEQIHILGSKQDIEGFKNYVNTIKSASYTFSTNESVNDAISSADNFVKTTYGNLTNRVRFVKNKVLGETVATLSTLGLEEEINDMNLANLADALKTILKQTDHDLNTPLSNEDGKYKGGILPRLEFYEGVNINDIINDPVARKEFIVFMSSALRFLNGVVQIDSLQSTSGTEFTEAEKVVNELIKQLQALTPNIKNANAKFEKLYEKYVEAELFQYSSNPDIIAGLKKILDPADDENYAQRMLDALADTNNSFVALLVKKFAVAMTNADIDSNEEISSLEALLRKQFGKNITSLTDADFHKYLEFKNGKPTGRLIQKYNMDAFYKAKAEYFKYYREKYGADSLSYKRAAAAWYGKTNEKGEYIPNNEIKVVTDEEIANITRKKQEELIPSEFEEWKNRNLGVVNGRVVAKINDAHFAVPSDKYLNPEWIKIKDDLLYQEFIKILSTHIDNFGRATILNKGFIPTLVAGKEKTTFKEKFEGWVESNSYHRKSEQFVGENDEMVYVLTIPMINVLSNKQEIKYSDKKYKETWQEYERRVLDEVEKATGVRYKSLKEIRIKNKEIQSEIQEEHSSKLNYNLYEVFSQFIKEGNRYKAKSNIKHEYDIAMHKLRIMKFNKRDTKGELLRNRLAGKALDKTVTGETTKGGTNLEQHFVDWMEAIFYENFDIDEGAWTTISKMLLKYTSAKNMWFNITAGVNNVMIGKIQTRLESFAGWYFKNDNLLKADKLYLGAMSDMFINLGSTKAGNLTNAIIKLMDVTQNTNERDYTTGMLRKQLWSWSSMYFMNDMGEHYLQNVSTLAMMDHHRIINGEIISLAEFEYNNYKTALYDIISDKEKVELDAYLKRRYENEEFKESKKDYLRDYLLSLPLSKQSAFVEAKKKLDANSKQQFESYPKLMDAFYLDENGYAKMREEVTIDGKKYNTALNKNEFALFKNKAIKVVQKQQGIYNKEDAGMFQRRALGKMLLQFRKYMRPGWNKRFGSKFGKSYWTESRDEWDKGSYISLWQFLKTPFNRDRSLNTEEGEQARSAMGRIMSDMGKFATNIGIYWNTLDDFEKGNVRRAVTEMIYLSSVLVVAMMLGKLKPDDDDDDNMAYDFLVYEVDRLLSEVGMFNPVGLINEGQKILKSPAAVQGTAMDAYKFISSLISYPIIDEEKRYFTNGVYSKELKVKTYGMKLVPVLNKWQQLMRINKFNKYYILFRG